MFAEAITLDFFSDLLETMEVRSRADTGLVLVYTGWHPEVGECVLLQHFTAGATLVSERRRRKPRRH